MVSDTPAGAKKWVSVIQSFQHRNTEYLTLTGGWGILIEDPAASGNT
jgi:hypothetical protein